MGRLLLAGVTVAVFASRRRYAAVGWLWFLGTLVPVIGLVQAGLQGTADRYTYVPLIGIGIAWAAAELVDRGGGSAARIGAVAWGVSVGVLAAVAWVQVGTWRDSTTLFEHALSIAPSADIHNNLGGVHRRAGRIDEAMHHYRGALQIDPGHALANRNLSLALRERGEYAEAVQHWMRFLEACGRGADPETRRGGAATPGP